MGKKCALFSTLLRAAISNPRDAEAIFRDRENRAKIKQI